MLPKRCVIVASGASLSEGLEKGLLSILEKECTFVINFNYHYIQGTANFFCDVEFYNQEKPYLDKLGLVIGKDTPKFGKIYPVGDNVILLEAAGRYFGKQSFKKGIYSGALTGLFTLTTAIALGFQEIFLLGYDFSAINGKTHFYQGNKEGIGIVKKEDGEPGKYRETTGVGFNKSEPSLYATGCYNAPAEILFDAYHPCQFMDIDLTEIEWIKILQAAKDEFTDIHQWVIHYIDSGEKLIWLLNLPNRIKERDDYLAFHEFKKLMIQIINKMVYELGMGNVTEIFYPHLNEWHGLRKELQSIKIINVSPLSKINTFPKWEYDYFFNYLKDNPVNVFQDEARNEIRKIIETNK